MPVSKHFWLAVMIVILLCWLLGCASAHAFDPKEWREIASNDQGQAFALTEKLPLQYDRARGILRAVILTVDRTDKEAPFAVRFNTINCSERKFAVHVEELYGPLDKGAIRSVLNPAPEQKFATGSLLDSLCIGARAQFTGKLI